VDPEVRSVLSIANLDQLFTSETATEATRTSKTPASQYQLRTSSAIANRIQRVIDIVGAIGGLTITAVLFIAISIAIKLDSPGPIFSSEIRCGLRGKRFRIWKFRSLAINAPQTDKVQNQVADNFLRRESSPKMTWVGRFLHKTNLDKLPMFWNVLVGDMSFAGFRAPTIDELERYSIPEWSFLDVKPGISGEWQMNSDWLSTVQNAEGVLLTRLPKIGSSGSLSCRIR
jgi:lipopolysaccharide/colanic/teichoic acid biosynthesis glycosyltransferase